MVPAAALHGTGSRDRNKRARRRAVFSRGRGRTRTDRQTTIGDWCRRAWASTPLEHWGVAGRAPKTRESRRSRRREGRVWGGAGSLPRKFMNFSSQNGVIWCILGVLFIRFMCPMDCSCMINFVEVPEVKHLSKYWGVVSTGRPLQVKYWGSRPLQPLRR